MNEKSMLVKKNEVYVTGTLVDVKSKSYVTWGPNDTEAISVKLVIKVVRGEEEDLIEVGSFQNKIYAKSGKTNPTFTTLENIEELLDTRVALSGASLKGERFWLASTSQLVEAPKINFSFIRAAKITDEDQAVFYYQGFVVRALAEKLDQDEKVSHYTLSLGQANYNEDNMHVLTFVVENDRPGIIKGIQDNYELFNTVYVKGILTNKVTIVTKTEEVAFGDPEVRSYTKTDRRFVITGAGLPIIGVEDGEYTTEFIKKLNVAYVEEAAKLQSDAKNKQDDTPVSSGASKPAAKKDDLAGFIL